MRQCGLSINGADITETVNTNAVIQGNITQGKNSEKRFIAAVTNQTVTDKIRNTVSSTDYSFDAYGVLTKKETSAAIAVSITEYSNFKKRTSGGLIAYLPQMMKVTNRRNGNSDYVFTSTYAYNSSGDIQSAVEMKGTYAQIKTDYTYYPSGNVHTVTTEPANHDQPAKTVTYGYDPKYRFVTSTETVTGTSYKTYDDFGRMLNIRIQCAWKTC